MTNSAGPRTAIRAGWVVAFDGQRQVLLENGVVVWQGGDICHVGPDIPEDITDIREEPGKLLIPGLISTHAHIGIHAGDRLIVDRGRRDLFFTGYLNYYTRKSPTSPSLGSFEDARASARFGVASLLRSGVTTVLDMGSGGFGTSILDAAEQSGIRLYYGPALAVADYVYGDAGEVVRHFHDGAEPALLAQTEAFLRDAATGADGRLRPAVVVDELFTATPDLLTGAKDLADRLGAPFTLHVAEQVYEFHETLRRFGSTPIGLLRELGVLDRNVVLGHAMYAAGHSLTGAPPMGDLEAIAASGASVAHAPLAWARRGVVLEDFRRYRERGIVMSIGTDSYPQDILLEMQMASSLGKVAAHDPHAATAGEIFSAATLGGAAALGRADLGRLAVGAKADMVLVDLSHPRIGPVFDPIRSLLHTATADQVEAVIVDGRYVVDNGTVVFAPEEELVTQATASARQAWSRFSEIEQSGRSAEAAFPLTFKRY